MRGPLALIVCTALATTGCEQILGIHDLEERPNGVDLVVAPDVTQDFGSVTMGNVSAPVSVAITNRGTAPSGEVTVALAGTDPDAFLLSAGGCDRSLAPQDSCTAEIRFRPTTATSQLASLSAEDGSGASAEVSLVGRGVVPLVALPAELAFGNIVVGSQSVAAEIQVINTGGSATGEITVGLMSTSQFEIVAGQNQCQDAELPPGGSCSLKIRFNPTAGGDHMTGLLVSAADLGALTTPLTGTGLAPGDLAIGPVSHDFGGQTVDTQSGPVAFVIGNNGGTNSGALTVESNSGVFIEDSTCDGVDLGPGGMCVLHVAFAPDAAGQAIGSLTASSPAAGSTASSLSGTGTASLRVVLAGAGSGQVASAPGGIGCPDVTCQADFSVSSVTLTATPAGASVFDGWSGGGCTGRSLTCTVPMDQSQVVTATFVPTTARLTVQLFGGSAGGTGSGSVTSPTHGQINCSNAGGPDSCEAVLTPGTSVTLEATAASGAYFAIWCGVCINAGASGTCDLVVNADANVQAYFCNDFGPCAPGC